MTVLSGPSWASNEPMRMKEVATRDTTQAVSMRSRWTAMSGSDISESDRVVGIPRALMARGKVGSRYCILNLDQGMLAFGAKELPDRAPHDCEAISTA